MPGPLADVRIIDLTSMVSGPACTMLLADQGADVIKVEPKEGDLVRRMSDRSHGMSTGFISLNRGKRSIALDLKDDAGREALADLIRTADVFVQNFRPGTIERMGFGEEAVRTLRDDIIYVSISGFGAAGPYAAKRVYDPVIQALSGLADIQSDGATGRPKMVRTIIPDKTTALTAAQAVTAALFARERTGIGQHVRLAMLDAMVAYLWPEGLVGHTLVGHEVHGSRAQFAQDLVFETQDGYITVGAVSDIEWHGLCRATGKDEWLADERFKTTSGRVKNAAARIELLQAVLRDRRSEEWLQRLDAEGVPCAPILRREEVYTHAQIKVNDLMREFDHPVVGRVRQPRPAAHFDRTPEGIAGPAPGIGEHGREILASLGYSREQIGASLSAGTSSIT